MRGGKGIEVEYNRSRTRLMMCTTPLSITIMGYKNTKLKKKNSYSTALNILIATFKKQ